MSFDGQVVRREPKVRDLMDQFVTVRMVQGNSMDLTTFQFDYDLTFSVFFMNADGTIYGRYGTRSDQKEALRDISIGGFRKALAGALGLHRNYPENRTELQGKRGPEPRFKKPEQYPSLSRFQPMLDYDGQVARSCMHCHMVQAAERTVVRDQKKPMPDKMVFPYPMPDVLGLTLSPDEKAKVIKVARGSSAEKNGFKPGDEILALEGQPILSIADVQWVLHNAPEPSELRAEVLRGGKRLSLNLVLAEGWRRAGSISWRTTSWDLRRMATGGMLLKEMTEAERQKAGARSGQMALYVKHAGRYGAHAAARRAGFRPGDVLVSFDGRPDLRTETELFTYVLQNRMKGDRVPVTVLRRGKSLYLKLPMQ